MGDCHIEQAEEFQIGEVGEDGSRDTRVERAQ
jgi:hypothetical protein